MNRWHRDDVRTVVNSALRSNTYLVATGQGSDCVVVDPGLDRDAIQAGLAESGWTPTAVLCTHGHFDHVGNAAWLQATYGVPVHLPKADLKLARMSNFMMAAFKIPEKIALPEFTLVSGEDASVTVGGRAFRFHALPGHTPGSCGIALDDLLFSGDTLYARRTALSKLPGENHEQLRATLNKLFTWIDGGVRVLPGHGGNATIDEIRAGNEELRAFLAAGSAPTP
jgi:hydroxyacylglutathione hydrolase